MEYEMRSISEDIRLCLQEIRRNIFVLFLLALLGLVIGGIGSLFVKESTYQARACIYNAKYISYYETTAIEHFIQNTQALVQSYKIAEEAAELLGSGEYTPQSIQSSVYAETEEDSILAWIVCETYSPQRAVQIVNAYTEALTAEMKSMSGSDNIQVLEYAKTSSIQRNLNSVRMIIITAIPVSFVILGCFVIAMRMLLSPRILSLDRCTLNGRINLLGVIPEISKEEGAQADRGKKA